MKPKFNVGGQAVIEGVMMRSPGSFTVAVRRPDGSIAVREQKWASVMNKYRPLRWPFFRGMIVLFESLYNGMSALAFSADQAASALEENDEAGEKTADTEEKSGGYLPKSAIFLTMVVSFALAIALFKFLPHLTTIGIGSLLGIDIPINGFAFHIIDGVVKLLVFAAYIWGISFMPDMKRVFMYHGAEHKSIAAYEAGGPLTVEKAREQSRFHPRCGTSFIVVVLMVAIVMFAVVFRFLPPLSDNHYLNIVLQMFIKVPLMLPVAGLAYEFIKFSSSDSCPRALRIFTLPGLWSQRITTSEPDDDMLEIALVSLKLALAREEASRSEGAADVAEVQGISIIQSLDEVA